MLYFSNTLLFIPTLLIYSTLLFNNTFLSNPTLLLILRSSSHSLDVFWSFYSVASFLWYSKGNLDFMENSNLLQIWVSVRLESSEVAVTASICTPPTTTLNWYVTKRTKAKKWTWCNDHRHISESTILRIVNWNYVLGATVHTTLWTSARNLETLCVQDAWNGPVGKILVLSMTIPSAPWVLWNLAFQRIQKLGFGRVVQNSKTIIGNLNPLKIWKVDIFYKIETFWPEFLSFLRHNWTILE